MMANLEVAGVLDRLLKSILLLADAPRSEPNSESHRSPAKDFLEEWQRLESFSVSAGLHHRTRGKLATLMAHADPLRRLSELLARPVLPEPFEASRLHAEVAALCDHVAELLSPEVEYYQRRQVANERPVEKSALPPKRDGTTRDDERYPEISRSAPRAASDAAKGSRRGISDEAVPGVAMELASRFLLINGKPPVVKVGPTEVPVYFGTSRSVATHSGIGGEATFSNDRGVGELTVGRAVVSIPRGHRIGELERPLTVWKFRFKPNPDKHVVLRRVATMTADGWTEAMRADLGASERRSAFVFIHGFNVSFEQSVLRAAQIARDISYEGIVTAFSWGSQASGIDGYPADEDAVVLAFPMLKKFLERLRTQVQVDEFHIVAHSMGCRALLTALQDTTWWNATQSPVAEAVFAAPDVDAEIYRQTILAIPNRAQRYTLYGSERDWALAISRAVRKNLPRAGDGGKNILVLKGVETVDVTNVGEHLFGLGHSYIGDKRTVLADLWAVLRGQAMPRFGLEEISHSGGKYWLLRP